MIKKIIISAPTKVALKLKVLAKEKESVRLKLVVTAKGKERVRKKLVVTAKQLAVTAKQLATTAKEKESIRRKLAVTAKEKERVRNKLVTTAKKLKEFYKTLEKKVLERTKDLEEVKAKDEAMLASIADGVIIIDPNGKVILINQSAQNLLGWNGREITDKLFFNFVPIENEKGEQVSAKTRPMAIALAAGTTTTGPTYYYIRKDKTKFPVAINVAPVMLKNKIIGAIEVFRDMTKENEIDKAKTEFVSLASHQLRTPLTAISWYTEMILNGDVGKVPPGQKKYLEEIYQSNKRMIELVNTLLNVSHIELGTFTGKPVQTDIGELVHSIIDEQKPKIKEKRIILREKLSKNIPLFSIDPKFLRMVFQNLLSNAVAYTPVGGKIELSISLVSSSKQALDVKSKRNSVLIKVSDTGYGIPKHQQDKIFTKLFRADNVKEKDTEGTGLGLYIVKSIVENAGGRIWFESKENEGTNFFVELPLSGVKNKKNMT